MAVHLASVFETLMYEYAKLIADRAVEERNAVAPAARVGNSYWSFVSRTFKKLSQGELAASAILRENKLLVSQGQKCAYCEATQGLQWEHIVPLSRGGPDTIDNLVLSCAKCNREKGARNPIEWYFARGLDRKYVPRIVMGKLVKLALDEHQKRGSLRATEYPVGEGLHLSKVCLVFDRPIDEPSQARLEPK